ncbi:MAG: hypothetical protein ACLVI9_14890 [Anaerostipes hadrus]
MIQLFSEGAYLVDGTTLVKESEAEALNSLQVKWYPRKKLQEHHSIWYFKRPQHIR